MDSIAEILCFQIWDKKSPTIMFDQAIRNTCRVWPDPASLLIDRFRGKLNKEKIYRQPSPGATYFKIEESKCTLYSTPNVLGMVRSSVSASWIASSSDNSFIN